MKSPRTRTIHQLPWQLRLGMAGLVAAALGGCTTEVGVAPVEGTLGQAEQAAVSRDGVCSLRSVPEPIAVQVEAEGDGFIVTVTNTAAEPADVSLRATAIGDTGYTEKEKVASLVVDAGVSQALFLDAKAIGLANVDSADLVTIDAHSVFPSGRISGITGQSGIIGKAARALSTTRALPPAPVRAASVTPAVAFAGAPASAVAPMANVNKKLCFKANINVQGSGQGEDIWPQNSTQVLAAGQEFWGLNPAGTWVQLKADAAGCTTTQTMATGTWTIRAYSMGLLNGSSPITIQVYDTAALPWAVDFTVNVTTSTTQDVVYNAIDQIEAYYIVRMSLFRNSAALTSKTLGKTLRVTDGETSTTGTKDGIKLRFTDDDKKWDVSHEVGHWVEFNETFTHGAMAYDYTLSGPECADTSHSVGSREFTSAAHIEGFASFWAAESFNNDTETGCWTFFSGMTVDCAGSTTHATAYMETECDDGSSFAGHGNETDWQRMFWDLVSPWNSVTRATPRQILDFVITADAPSGTNWSTTNHYTLFNTASNAAATPDHLETRWDSFAPSNGIDH